MTNSTNDVILTHYMSALGLTNGVSPTNQMFKGREDYLNGIK